ncbi:MAG: CotH kinase family protein [Lachnospiraceae bacterium]|nr:CotH kinase family protein [Lachnospiraceae bacterium]
MKKLKKCLALMLSIAMVLSVVPCQVRAENTNATMNEDPSWISGDPEENPDEGLIDYKQAVLDEAKELGVPDAFIKHSFAADFEDANLQEPEFDLQEGEEPSYKMNTIVSAAGVRGLEIKSIDTGLLARAKFDLGEFDFGDMKVGHLVYNILAKKNMKGKAYLYLDDNTEAFATLDIKRSADSDWEEIRNKALDVSGMNLQDRHEIYFTFIADSALDAEGHIIANSGVKGSLFFESMFFTEGSTPVLDFDLDNEVNTIDRINGSEKHTIMGYGDMNVEIPEGYVSEYTDKPLQSATYELDYIRGRGNSTWLTSKKPYKIKLDKSTDLFGMGKSKHWVLLANYYDYSLVRNKMTYELAKRMGLEYTPKSVFVDVIISGEYCGSYQLSQHIRIGKENVNIDDLEENPATEEPDITGGYLLAMGDSWLKGDEGKPVINIDDNQFVMDKPEYDSSYPEDAKEAQVNYMTDYLEKLDQIIKGNNSNTDEEETTPDSELPPESIVSQPIASNVPQPSASSAPENEEKDWRDYMDEQSYIDYYLIQEVSKNGDAYGGSTYLYKKRNGKLYWGPVWDFDFVAWGAPSTDYLAGGSVEGFQCSYSNPWFMTLIHKDAAFKEKVVERWRVMSEQLKDITKDGGIIDQYKNQLYYSALANYQVRSSYLMDDTDYWEGEGIVNRDEEGNLYRLNYANEIDRLKRTINASVSWMDNNIENIDDSDVSNYPLVPFEVDGEVVAYVHYDAYNECFLWDEIPNAPEKEGMKFKGWYYKDEDGEERKFREDVWPYYYTYTEGSEENTEERHAYTFYAKYIPIDSIVEITQINSFNDTYFIPMESWGYETGDEMYYDSEVLFLDQLISVVPFDADETDVEYELAEESDDISVTKNGAVSVYKPGEYTVKCIAGDVTKEITIVGVDSEEISYDRTFGVASELSLDEGNYGSLGLTFAEENIGFGEYRRLKIMTLNPDVVKVDKTGHLYANKAGKATIIVVQAYGEEAEIRTVDVTVNAVNGGNSNDPKEPTPTANPVKPTPTPGNDKPANDETQKLGKVTIKKVFTRKKSDTKIKLTLSKVKGAKGYQVCVYKTKKQAKKDTSALLKKNVKSVNVSVKSKKLKNQKKLFVKVRAYNKSGKTTTYGAWSDIKTIKSK